LDGTASAGRKGIAYLRDYYTPPPAAEAADTEPIDDERTLVTGRRTLSGS
jgi:hypothetical protein